MTNATLVRPTAVTPAQPSPGGCAVVAAVPEELRSAARLGRATEVTLLEAAAVLRGVGAALVASGSGPVGCAPALPALEPLADGLLAVVAVGRQLDAHLDRVAAALDAADAGALTGPPCPARPGPNGLGETVATEAARAGVQEAVEEGATRAARGGQTGLRGAMGQSVLDIALALGRPLPRRVVAVAAKVPLLSLALAPLLAAEQTVTNGTPYPDALLAETAGALAGAGLIALAGAALGGVLVTSLPLTAAVFVAGAAAGWVATRGVGWLLAQRRRRQRSRP